MYNMRLMAPGRRCRTQWMDFIVGVCYSADLKVIHVDRGLGPHELVINN